MAANEPPTVRLQPLGPASAGVRLEVAALVGAHIWLAGAGAGSARVISFDPATGRVSAVLDISDCGEVWGAAALGSDLVLATGQPAQLIIVDTLSGRVTERHLLPSSEQHRGQDPLTAWSVAVAPDGEIIVGTAPDGALWGLRPRTGELRRIVELADKDPVFVRTLVASQDALYCGLGPRAGLVRVDRTTGATTDLTPDGWDDLTFVRTCARVGDWLLAGTTPYARLVAVDLTGRRPTRTWQFPHGEPYVTGIHATDDRVWITTTRSNSLWALDPAALDDDTATGGTTAATAPELVTVTQHGATALGSLPDGRLWVMQDGLALVDPGSGAVTVPSLDWSRARRLDATRALCWADGRVYVAGESGLRVHPDDGRGEVVGIEASGVDCFAAGPNHLLLGGPPDAELRTLPYGGTSIEAVAAVAGHRQRYVTTLAHDAPSGLVVMGTRPDYGATEGALVVVDPATRTVVSVWRGVLAEQSVTAVAVADGPRRESGLLGRGRRVLVGGSIDNGEGTVPQRSTAQIALVGNDELRWVAEPVREARTVTDLCVLGELVVGVTDGGTAFGIDLADGAVRWTVQVARSGGRLCVLDGVVHGTDGNVLWALSLDGDAAPTSEVLADDLRGVWSGPPTVVTDGRSALFTLQENQLVRVEVAARPARRRSPRVPRSTRG